jgi:hypothetical protein
VESIQLLVAGNYLMIVNAVGDEFQPPESWSIVIPPPDHEAPPAASSAKCRST